MINDKPIKKYSKAYIVFAIFVYIAIAINIVYFYFDSSNENNEYSSESKSFNEININQNIEISELRWKLLNSENRGNILKASESDYPSFLEDKIINGKFIEITIEVENLSKKMSSVSSDNLYLIDNKNREFAPASNVDDWIPNNKELFLSKDLSPNMPMQFIKIFEVPIDANELKLKIKNSSAEEKEFLINLGF